MMARLVDGLEVAVRFGSPCQREAVQVQKPPPIAKNRGMGWSRGQIVLPSRPQTLEQ